MDILSLAISARMPFVLVRTEDLVNYVDVLSNIADEEVEPFTSQHIVENSVPTWPAGDVFYCHMEGPDPWLYKEAKKAGKCLVFVNTKVTPLHFNAGTLIPPKKMVLDYLTKVLGDPAEAEALLTAFGGLTLKDAYEIVKMAQKEFGELTAKGINAVRGAYITKLKGIHQVDTEIDFYQCPKELGDWMSANLFFFENEVHKHLTPRGLLFDGIPGTGKTMGAKFIAKALGVPLYRLDVGAMKGKYVGDSEGNLNAALAQVDAVAPCVVIFDEIEKIFTETGDQGVTTSLLSTLLWWLQEHKSKVFTVMTTNKVDKIPPELWREERIDQKLVFTGLSKAQREPFAENVYNLLASQIGYDVPWAAVKGQLLESLPSNVGGANGNVAQAKMAQHVYAFVKKLVLASKQPVVKPAVEPATETQEV